MGEFMVFNINLFEQDMSEKTRLGFELFDVDQSGGIDREELIRMLKGTHLADDEEDVVAKADRIMEKAVLTRMASKSRSPSTCCTKSPRCSRTFSSRTSTCRVSRSLGLKGLELLCC